MFAVVCALLWLLLDDPESRGPLIQGKPASYWTRRLRADQVDPEVINAVASEKSVAIPALVQQLSLPDSTVKDFAKRLWLRLPAALRNRVPEPTTRAELRGGAAHALVVVCRRRSIARTGPTLSEAQLMLPALNRALQDRDARVRSFVTVALGYLGVISAQAIDACDVALKDQHWWVRANAVHSLGRLAKSDERAIRRLRSALADSHPQVHDLAAQRLELLGKASPRDDASSATEAE